jgi:hypothetical protein
MDGLNLDALIKLAANFGIPGIVLVIWFFSDRSHERTLRQYREDMIEQRRMYENNVELVRQYTALAKDLKDVVMLNTQTITRLCDDVNRNQFCPMVRLKKDACGRQE